MDYLKKLAKRLFQYEADLVLKKYKPKVIAITGSVGKTLTKEAIYLVMSKRFHVRKSEKSFTTELGVPLAIIGCNTVSNSVFQWIKNLFLGLWLILLRSQYPEWLILEIDTDKPGDLQSVYQYLSPDILVMTAIGQVPAHIEAFGDMENFLHEKRHIVESVKREGVIIYNADDDRTGDIVGSALVRKVPVGVGEECSVRRSDYSILYGSGKNAGVPTGMMFDILHHGLKFTLNIFDSIGEQNEYACLLAFGVGIELGIPAKDIAQSLNKFSSLPGRMSIIAGMKDSVIIDDSYNAAPLGMSQAISVLTDIAAPGKKIVVLGDMLELGKYSAEEHKKIAPMLNHTVDFVFTVGIRSKKIIQELLDMGFDEEHMQAFDDSAEAGLELRRYLEPGDIILVKGSQGMRMERVVEIIMKHHADMSRLLVRQEKEWKNRD